MDTYPPKPFAVLRIAFGLIWLVNAAFKWNPAFLNNFSGYLTAAAQGQPQALSAWIWFFIKLTSINPHAFAVTIAVTETAIALFLIFGFFTRPAIIAGMVLSLLIWTTAEGFGGPYIAGSTDVGAGIIYVFVFWALWLGRSWQAYSLDSLMAKSRAA